ncbi:DoxX family membrane protein [Haloferax namakaokahaiae]|uniref:DoxX family membrane protein n=1 Tax=Haloferax namakaokahaiae TaxID=1748331 RepID=A0ABD5ZDF2_9EURY
MTDSSSSKTAPPVLARLLYSGVLVYMSVDGFRHNETRVEIAREKGVPIPEVLVPFTTGMLLVANLLLLVWRFPKFAAGAVIVFFVGTTPAIHNFWELEGEERHGNKINFCKNLALIGGAIALLDEAAKDD